MEYHEHWDRDVGGYVGNPKHETNRGLNQQWWNSLSREQKLEYIKNTKTREREREEVKRKLWDIGHASEYEQSM